ncbi:hypothetical protein [Alcanivorax sp.]|uniref:hypothetical protein n=1 Tax=Alcanivorax sp. TaxID=1872427 RepID=UPI0025BAAAC6|nr:hypothetical protein [Alcanivorax sp.]
MPRTISEKALLTMKASQYMNASQRQFFRKRLAALAHDCEQHIGSARNNLQTPAQADPLVCRGCWPVLLRNTAPR